MVSPATGHVDTEWFDEFWEECLILECRIDYIATHLYTGTIDERMKKLKDYSQRYGKQIWLTEFAVALGTIHILRKQLLGGGHCALNGVLRGHFLGIKMPQ